MSDMNCPYCNSPVPLNASQCPGCGAPVQQQTPPFVQPTMPQAPIVNQPAAAPINRRNRVVYIMLGVFLGCLGIHNFYAGRTGRGDTVFGSYIAMRCLGADLKEALRYATACVSLKMETPGPFAGTREDVEAYYRLLY